VLRETRSLALLARKTPLARRKCSGGFAVANRGDEPGAFAWRNENAIAPVVIWSVDRSFAALDAVPFFSRLLFRWPCRWKSHILSKRR